MTTAAVVVAQILNEITVRQSEAPIEADEAQDTIFTMNAYMASQDANGIHLGYTSVNDLADQITVPDGALMGIIANVAIMMAPTFGATISQGLVVKAKIGLQAMRKLGVSVQDAFYPDTLPIGSGNEWSYTTNHFYRDRQDEILTEQNGSILLEQDTNV